MKKEQQPAFPIVNVTNAKYDEDLRMIYHSPIYESKGLSLRQHYAGKALQGLLTPSFIGYLETDKGALERVVSTAFLLSDAMIDFEEKEGNE